METERVLFALGLTLLAGMSTAVGSALAFFTKKTNIRFLSAALGFSAGVMIYVSFVEIFFKARASLAAALGNAAGSRLTAASFFAGIALAALIDRLVPDYENPHEMRKVEDADKGPPQNFDKLYRAGLFTAVAIAVHNFPEGLATFIAGLKDPTLAVPVAVAIAIHNIPEGIAVSIPVYYATGNRKKAFVLSSLSGLAEPAGAVIGFALLYPFFNDVVFGILFAAVAGIMVFISLDELLPSAEKYGEHHLSIYGLVAGMLVMALSLLMFG